VIFYGALKNNNIKPKRLSRHGGVAGTEGGHGERQNTVKGGGLVAPERAS